MSVQFLEQNIFSEDPKPNIANFNKKSLPQPAWPYMLLLQQAKGLHTQDYHIGIMDQSSDEERTRLDSHDDSMLELNRKAF